MKYSVVIKIIFFLGFFSNNVHSQDKDSIEILSLEEIEAEHPNLSMKSNESFYSMDVYELMSISEQKTQVIQQLFFSIHYYLNKDTCLSDLVKLNLVSNLDSLQNSYSSFLTYSQEVDNLSYGNGRQAGFRSLIYKISFQQEFISYLKYWFSSFYFVYLEPGVQICDDK